MTDKKLTDNEIIKALESEIHLAEYVDSDYCSNVNLEIIKSALDLIVRQQEEIERLKEFIVETRRCDKEIKAEAVKEFADEFKSRCIKGGIYPAFVNRQLENVKKEMAGENNDL